MKRGIVMRRVYLITILAVAVSTACAAPYWGSDVAGTTYQEWNFVSDDTNPAADVVDNDYATGPILGTIKGSAFGGTAPMWQNGTWSNNVLRFEAIIPNTDITTPDSYKDIVIEIGYQGDFSLAYAQAVTGEYFVSTGTEYDSYFIDNVQWTIRRDYYHIEPNPTEEYICYMLNQEGPLQSIDYVYISTQCIPEPATMCLLGLGGLMLRKKRKA